MAENKSTQSRLDRLRHKYRLSIYNDSTYEEVLVFRLSRLNVFSILGGGALLIIVLVTVLIAFTPIRELIPGYPDGKMRRMITQNAFRLDSLEREIQIRDSYFASVNAIISGEVPDSIIPRTDSAQRYENIEFKKSVHDSLLRIEIEQEEQYNLTLMNVEEENGDFSNMHFFPPIKGIVTNPFNSEENHFGTDIVTSQNNVVKATLSGTVTLADWTLETGYVIQVQHENNIISVYKHNAELLKTVGNLVKAGEPIAIVGNSGELTTGPHLHFEIWHDGVALNPEDYIVF